MLNMSYLKSDWYSSIPEWNIILPQNIGLLDVLPILEGVWLGTKLKVKDDWISMCQWAHFVVNSHRT